MTTNRPWMRLLAVGLTTVLALSACGSDDQAANDATSSPAAAEGSGAPGGRAGGGAALDEKQLAAIQECLDAAGIEADLPTGAPTDLPDGVPTDLPTDFPTDLPSDFPSDGASGLPGGGGGGMGALLTPEVQAALAACGIELPAVGAPDSE